MALLHWKVSDGLDDVPMEGVVVGHVLMLLSHPESHAFDMRLLDAHEKEGARKGVRFNF